MFSATLVDLAFFFSARWDTLLIMTAVSQATSEVSNDVMPGTPASKTNPIAVTMFSYDVAHSDSLHIEKGRNELVPSSNRPRSYCCWVCVASIALPALLIILLLLLSTTVYKPVAVAADNDSFTAGAYLHELQCIGTHNSYRQQPAVTLSEEWRYSHEPLLTQLRLGLRHFELDLHVASFNQRRFRVQHVQLFDDKASCQSVHECVAPAYAWSQAVGGKHAPVTFMFEFKEQFLESVRTNAVKVKAEQIASLEAEIKQAWPGAILTPADAAETWPYKLDSAMGKAVFLLRAVDDATLSNSSVLHWLPYVPLAQLKTIDAARTRYITTNSVRTATDAARVKAAVARNIIVRMRIHSPADNPGNVTTMALVESSGAQLIATDHPLISDSTCCSQRQGTSAHTRFSTTDNLARLFVE